MSGENYLRAAYSYLYIGEFGKASEAFQRAIEEDPQNAAYYFHGSVTALRNGQTERALCWAKQAAQLKPDDALYGAHLAMVESVLYTKQGTHALETGALEEARQALQEAVATNPLNEEAHALLEQLGPLEQPGPAE
ncbi:tetratricopeptide repeat protein [Alicyclobacillus cycloheptanicus]|uniref:Tetratricopeptide (TPR) repeat protein n=1 Tax=Alicyclobacillus cycloheptanicus TaxID=1457 RepID=A0ABT9XE58_9BACL|nr:tetratricopeptide repeat protein [Alicyclobacillus cycloheptanicus]MDQ0188565.1 tetratricopeptide (TPR) repeat protein [Alicyclobacillus cycloheptanicus]WDM01246.1 tetratricopeptide repeat protein [Alicyclobacillus cycloheptanicus]